MQREIMICNGIKKVAAAGLALILAGCSMPPVIEDAREETPGITRKKSLTLPMRVRKVLRIYWSINWGT